jgi:signal transduction histidine kinase
MNAAKYTPAGGRIVARIANRNGAATVEIEDNGSGISAEDLPHIFDLFNQGQDHRYQPKGGLGIGLSIVRTIVRLHGGEVSAHSPGPGRGSTFAVRLPACG